MTFRAMLVVERLAILGFGGGDGACRALDGFRMQAGRGGQQGEGADRGDEMSCH